MPTEKQGKGERRPTRPPSVSRTGEKFVHRVPPGTILLAEQISIVMRRWNGLSVGNNVAVAEALLALAERLGGHPHVTDGERAVIRERAAAVNAELERFYANLEAGPNIVRPHIRGGKSR